MSKTRALRNLISVGPATVEDCTIGQAHDPDLPPEPCRWYDWSRVRKSGNKPSLERARQTRHPDHHDTTRFQRLAPSPRPAVSSPSPRVWPLMRPD